MRDERTPQGVCGEARCQGFHGIIVLSMVKFENTKLPSTMDFFPVTGLCAVHKICKSRLQVYD